MKRAIYAGSFDPVTNGHLWVIEKGLEMYDELIVVIGVNPSKKYYFSIEERVSFLSQALQGNPRVKVKVEQEYLAVLAEEENIEYFLRGVRNNEDFSYEKMVEGLNQVINPKLQSVHVFPPAHLGIVSSSAVKSLVGFPNWPKTISSMVPVGVKQGFAKKIYEPELLPYWKSLHIDNSKWWEKIIRAYTEEQRAYHTLEHLAELFRETKNLRLNLFEDQVLTLSIFFHDFIYQPQSQTNEEDSTLEFEIFAKEVSLHPEIKSCVREFILATKSHQNPKQDPLLDTFLDLDLSILGSSPRRFKRYEKEIREEYAFVSEEIYQRERKKILSRLALNTFKTPWAKEKWEKQAKENLDI